MANAMQLIFDDNMPKKLWVDEGKRFYNKDVIKLYKKYNIENIRPIMMKNAL